MKPLILATLAAVIALPQAALAQPIGQGPAPVHATQHKPLDTRAKAPAAQPASARKVTPKAQVQPKRQSQSQPKPRPLAKAQPTVHLAVGTRLDSKFIAQHETIRQPARYRLAHTGANTRWLRVRNDAVMVNLQTGRVLNIAYNLFR